MLARRSTIGSLAGVVLLAVAAGGTGAHTIHHRHIHQRIQTMHEQVRRPGIYRVSMVVRSKDGAHAAISLRIGKVTREAKVGGRRRKSVVRVDVTVHHHHVTVYDTSLRGHATLLVRLQRIAAVPQSPRPAARGVTRGASGSSAPSGATGSSGASGATGSSGSGGSSSGSLVPAGVGGSWNLVFNDSFTGSSLDTSKWSTGWFGSGVTRAVDSNEIACYDPANVSEGNGELDLSMTQQSTSCGGATQPYDGAAVTTNGKFEFTYGFVEVRAWLAGNGSTVYDWPQIWLDGQSWPTDGEIDILEGLGGGACYHWHGPPDGTGYGGCASGTFTGGWHTFGMDWEPGIVTYYYDGNEVGSVTNATSQITADPMYLILIASTSAGSVTQAPVTERFSYVRVWQH